MNVRIPAETFPVRELIVDELLARRMTEEQLPAIIRRFLRSDEALRPIEAQALSALFATSAELWLNYDAIDRGEVVP